MTTKRDRKTNEVYFECDRCGDTHETTHEKFSNAWPEAQEAGFVFRAEMHLCGTCNKEMENF